ncbi:MAG: hypothetical protein KBT30_02860 [Clostridiales bacterium]|nr:hypothetical protein [Candidatus Apopatousia equi]
MKIKAKEKLDEKFEEDIVREVKEDFLKRQSLRKNYEKQWQLNMNFLLGNQYCGISSIGEVEDYQKQYFWQEREVYNHIAPLMEARASKLATVRPKMTVVPATNSDNDLNIAKVSKNILNAVYHKLDIDKLISEATTWSEICGTSFYKVVWNSHSGMSVGLSEEGKDIKEGEVDITVCPPYEIFPDNNNAEKIEDCMSIIHAKCYDVRAIKKIWGVDVKPETLDVMSMNSTSTVGGLGYTASINKVISQKVENSALVIEKYEAPTSENPNGKLTIIAGDKVLYIGELPYINGSDSKHGFPFIKQTSITEPNSFWGISVIERLIPIQRSYNAIKNRKHEFLNRMAMGILTVEDGSVDTDNLEEEGMSPGKVLIYRQGANKPEMMNPGSMPSDFDKEEEKLLNEFTQVSGVTEVLLTSEITSGNISGTALEVLIEQENNRLKATTDQIKFAIKQIGKLILRMYKQFATTKRICKIIGQDNSVEMFYFNGSDIGSDDVVLDTANEIGDTLAQKRSMIFELLNAGLLTDENGKISNRVRSKTLEMLGYGMWETQNDISELHMRKAEKENLKLCELKEQEVLSIDDHKLHIDEHIAFMLGGEYEKVYAEIPKVKEMFLQHIESHKKMMKGE